MHRTVALIARLVAVAAIGFVSVSAAPQSALGQSQAAVEVLAEYPSPAFLENLEMLPGGDLLFTSYLARTLEILTPGKPVRTFARLSAHPVSVLALGDGFLVSAHGAPFTSGPAFTQTQQFLVLDREGRETKRFSAPDARFLNGMVRLADGTVLIADSIAATIWAVDPARGTLTAWLQHEALAQDPATKEFRPGANGLKRRADRLVVSNSSRGTLLSIAIAADGRSGALTEIAKVGPIDDFLIEDDGAIVYTTHGAALMRRKADGASETLLAAGCDGCTSVARLPGSGARASYVVLTTGRLAEGGTDPARVLLVTPAR